MHLAPEVEGRDTPPHKASCTHGCGCVSISYTLGAHANAFSVLIKSSLHESGIYFTHKHSRGQHLLGLFHRRLAQAQSALRSRTYVGLMDIYESYYYFNE